MAAERIPEPPDPMLSPARRRRARPAAAANGHGSNGHGAPAHATVVLDRRDPVFDHATSHVLVADRTTGGRPLGGPTPAHLSTPARVRLRLARVGPLSAAKLALLFGALIVAAIVAGLVVLYGLLDAAGVLRAVQKLVNSSGVGHRFRFDGGWILIRVLWVAAGMVLAGAIVATCLAALYNSLADLTGGLDVTFVEHPDTVIAAAEAPNWTSRFRGTRLWRQDRVPDVPDPGLAPGLEADPVDDLDLRTA